jgi:hypothetical protein
MLLLLVVVVVFLQPGPDTRVVIPFLTHFADLSSWEYAQKLNQKVLPQLREQGIQVRS